MRKNHNCNSTIETINWSENYERLMPIIFTIVSFKFQRWWCLVSKNANIFDNLSERSHRVSSVTWNWVQNATLTDQCQRLFVFGINNICDISKTNTEEAEELCANQMHIIKNKKTGKGYLRFSCFTENCNWE